MKHSNRNALTISTYLKHIARMATHKPVTLFSYSPIPNNNC